MRVRININQMILNLKLFFDNFKKEYLFRMLAKQNKSSSILLYRRRFDHLYIIYFLQKNFDIFINISIYLLSETILITN